MTIIKLQLVAQREKSARNKPILNLNTYQRNSLNNLVMCDIMNACQEATKMLKSPWKCCDM